MAGDIELNPGPDNVCHVCNLNVSTGLRDLLRCDMCSNFLHKKCTSLSDSDFKLMSREEVTWICNGCKPFIKISNTLKLLDEKFGSLENNLIRIDEKIGFSCSDILAIKEKQEELVARINVIESSDIRSELDSRLSNMEARLSVCENSSNKYEDQVPFRNGVIEEVKATIESHLQNSIYDIKRNFEEEDQIKMREKNIVVFNLVESKDSSLKDDKHDKVLIERMLDILKLDSLKPSISFKRISSFNEKKARPLILSFGSVRDKWRFFSGHEILKKSDDIDIQGISIVPDRTMTQRVLAKKLRAELVRRRNLKEDVVLFRGEIVERSSLKFKKSMKWRTINSN